VGSFEAGVEKCSWIWGFVSGYWVVDFQGVPRRRIYGWGRLIGKKMVSTKENERHTVYSFLGR
jgi:hypothetical protein